MRYQGTPLINGTHSRLPALYQLQRATTASSHFRDNWTQLKTEWAPSDWFSVRNVAYRLTSKRHWRNAECVRLRRAGNVA